MSKKRVLLVSYLFAPNNSIGAVRPTKLAAGLAERGYDVDVVTYGYTPNDSLKDVPHVRRIYRMNESKPHSGIENPRKVGEKKKTEFGSLRYWIGRYYAALLSIKQGNAFLRYFENLYREELSKNEYDVVFSSFGPLCSLRCGFYLKKKMKSIKWICDFRDPAVTLTPMLLIPYFQFYQDAACRMADNIVCVSNGYLKRIVKGTYLHKASMIPNGYDLRDQLMTCGYDKPATKLKFAYAGALYNGKRDISVLFRAIRELADDYEIDCHNVSFEYAGTNAEIAIEQAEKYGLASIVVNHGVISREQSLQLQRDAQILVLVTWNDKVEQGVFPGKFLEYMLFERPILAIVNGDLPGSEVADVMDEGNFGFCYEEATHTVDYDQMKKYIKMQYDHFMKTGKTVYSPCAVIRERYNYEQIVGRIEELINE